MNPPNYTSTRTVIASIIAGEIALRDTTSKAEADSIRVVDALPRKVQTVDFLTGGYVVAKLYGPNREHFARLLIASPGMLDALIGVAELATMPADLRDKCRAAIAELVKP